MIFTIQIILSLLIHVILLFAVFANPPQSLQSVNPLLEDQHNLPRWVRAASKAFRNELYICNFFNIKYSIQNGLIKTKNKACLLLKYERILCFRQNELNWHRFKFAPSIFEELEKWLIWTKRCKISARRFRWCSTTMLFFKFDYLEEFYDRQKIKFTQCSIVSKFVKKLCQNILVQLRSIIVYNN